MKHLIEKAIIDSSAEGRVDLNELTSRLDKLYSENRLDSLISTYKRVIKLYSSIINDPVTKPEREGILNIKVEAFRGFLDQLSSLKR